MWPQFPAGVSQLQRYAARLNAVEINSSFYRPHPPGVLDALVAQRQDAAMSAACVKALKHG